MLVNHTHERLAALGLAGMAKAFDDQIRQPDVTALTFEQRLGLMIDREATERENKRLAVRLKFASLRQTAIIEDVWAYVSQARVDAVKEEFSDAVRIENRFCSDDALDFLPRHIVRMLLSDFLNETPTAGIGRVACQSADCRLLTLDGIAFEKQGLAHECRNG
jgi:hypothetical protein